MKTRFVLLLVLLLPAWAGASGVRATLDRSQVQLGETVTLNLSIDGGGNVGTPDLSPLAKDFDVLGSSSNSSISIVNGKRSARFTIGIALRPKHAGELEVPALAVAGGHTDPLKLEVTPPDPNAAGGGKDVFVEASVEPGRGYVGQQLLYTVRLYYAVNLERGSLDDPQLSGVDVRKLGKDVDYSAERGGRAYHVLERRYALVPRRAGTLVMPSLQFQGVAENASSPLDPGDFFGQSGLFGNGTTVTAASPTVTLHVQAPPSGWGSGAWLPARQLSLALDGLPAGGELRVGQPLNLHMSVQASGLPAETLPEPSLPALNGATVYPDRPVDTTTDDGKWLQGKRERTFAIVPQRAGALTIPATTLKWFNVQSGKTELASIPASTFTVLPAIGAAPAAPASTAPAPAAAASVAPMAGSTAPAAPATPDGAARWWRRIALASLGLWLLSMLGWWIWRRRRAAAPARPAAVTPSPDTSALRAAFLAAAGAGDAAVQARTLLAWARAERPGLQNLGALSAALASEPQRAAIAALQRRRYAGAPASAGDTGLRAAFERGFAWHGGRPHHDDSPLPPLYPFDLSK
jgi:hypothetical protein